MIRLEKLEMQNFKSFAKKTLITFPTNFSVVCGPNGSGKSNILDAICFTLGRISAKSLRADRMLEMIFHGGKSKKPADFAKVSLYFDNSDRKLPIDDNKVFISRRINKKGISIYKLNGRTVTREKIQEVLRSGHIRPDGHNIILQGDVTAVIEMGPLERREILDEISGIREFDEKRDKAQRELLTVEDRLKESHIILKERRSNIDRLEEEGKSAQKYEKLTKELDKVRASLAKQRLKDAEDAMKKLDEKINKKSVERLDEELEKIDKELEATEKRREDVSKRLFDRTKDIAIIKEVEKLKSEINRKKDKIDFDKLETQRLDGLIKRLELLKQRETTSKSVQEILKLGWTGVYGTIASLSKVSRKYQTAIEVAAGSHLHDTIVSNENIAIECVKHLKKNKIGRATFLPLDKIKSKDSRYLKKFVYESGVVGLALDLIEFDNKYYNAFSFVFGDTLVVNNIETTKRLGIGGARFVTLDGDLVERSGVIVGGFYRGKKAFVGSEEIEKYSSEKLKLQEEIKELENDLIKLKKELEQLTTKEQLGSKELIKMQGEREKLEETFESLRKKRKEVYEERLNIQDVLNKLRIRKARLEAELENLKLEFENYKKIETYRLSPEILSRRIKDTMSSINALGAINMRALEQYREQKAIYDDLKEKVDKLIEERNKILEIMAEVEGKRKEAFTKTLEGVREQFKIVFKNLTGGESDVRLAGGLDSGLLIEASPAGKKLLNIDAMSGGEKTLTALAFLFAIQRFRPAPFYILDEIDAALDKPNTKKAVNLFKKYSPDSQFIVITHNDTTIQAADCVYGCSMEDGESKLVGIKMPS